MTLVSAYSLSGTLLSILKYLAGFVTHVFTASAFTMILCVPWAPRVNVTQNAHKPVGLDSQGKIKGCEMSVD